MLHFMFISSIKIEMLVNVNVRTLNMEPHTKYLFTVPITVNESHKIIQIPTPLNTNNIHITGTMERTSKIDNLSIIDPDEPDLPTNPSDILKCSLTVNDDIDKSILLIDDQFGLSASESFYAKNINTLSIQYISGSYGTIKFSVSFN